MQRKLDHVRRNGLLARPDPAPTVLVEEEINAYFASNAIKLPTGVQSVRFKGMPGIITGVAEIDFDKLKSGRNSSNPLLSMFAGTHEVTVAAHAYGRDGQGYVEIDSVSLDDVEIPRFLLQLFVEKYLKPKYPNVGLDSRFGLPNRVDTATVGTNNLTLIQR